MFPFLKRYPNFFQVSLPSEAKTLAALSLGEEKVGGKNGKYKNKNAASFFISLKTFLRSRCSSSRCWKQGCFFF